ncbi:MAG: class F sortase [Micrococcus sp.]|nr:class F sortase [Micrococcus sp.]
MDVTAFRENLETTWEGSAAIGADGTTDGDTADTEEDTAGHAPAPAILNIPRIGLREEVLELGLEDDGTLEVPAEGGDVGWYSPDERAATGYPLVFTGHVDTAAGPAVFARLLELEPGDEVAVTDVGGQVLTYRVDRVADHPVDAYPTLDVFGPAPKDEIRLITCTGVFDDVRQQYEENRVVYASRSR